MSVAGVFGWGVSPQPATSRPPAIRRALGSGRLGGLSIAQFGALGLEQVSKDVSLVKNGHLPVLIVVAEFLGGDEEVRFTVASNTGVLRIGHQRVAGCEGRQADLYGNQQQGRAMHLASPISLPSLPRELHLAPSFAPRRLRTARGSPTAAIADAGTATDFAFPAPEFCGLDRRRIA